MTEPFVGYGTTLSRGVTAIAEVVTIGGPGRARSVHDITKLDNPTKWKKFIFGLIDPGELVVGIRWIPSEATHKTVIDDMEEVATEYTIVFSDAGAATLVFTGFLIGFEAKEEVDSPIDGTMTFAISGKPVLTP